jgi:hypothetical protein
MSNQSCPNCNHVITCGCQKRAASDGKTVCSFCINTYEDRLKIQQYAKNVNIPKQ